jgi:hypothetical protein
MGKLSQLRCWLEAERGAEFQPAVRLTVSNRSNHPALHHIAGDMEYPSRGIVRCRNRTSSVSGRRPIQVRAVVDCLILQFNSMFVQQGTDHTLRSQK